MSREGLAEVLTAITERPIGHWRAEMWSPAWRGGLTFVDTRHKPLRIMGQYVPGRVRWKVATDFARKTTSGRSALLTVESPAHGVERLYDATPRLWPWAPGDVHAPWWWCDRCARQGWQSDAPVACVCDRSDDVPPSLADLVAVASLGAATLRRVAELVRELHAVTGGETGATLVWRVMTREALREHREWCLRTPALGRHAGQALVLIFGDEEWRRCEGRTALTSAVWPEAFPHTDLPDDRAERRAYPILRALAVHEDGTPTGLHLVAADRTRVVIAVEAP